MTMDLRPALLVEGQVLRKYNRKRDNKLILSSTPTKHVSGQGVSGCRETLIHYLGNSIKSCTTNSKVETNPFNIEPLIYAMKIRSLIGHSHMSFGMGRCLSSQNINLLNDTSYINTIKKCLSYIPGIIGTCMSDSPLEDKRASHIKSNSSYASYANNENEFHYSALSNFWLVSPVTVSIMMGLGRNAISHVYDSRKDVEENLLSKVKLSHVIEVINTHNVPEARNIFNNVILPFYDKCYPEVSNFILLSKSNSNARKVITHLATNGIHKYFIPERMYHYWNSVGVHYGLNDFIDEHGTNPNRWRSL